ncbi:TrmB family transcriptional regulator [Nitrososphaera sp. AFS]|uniref:TrmB family transcriptional regulator n=1 Tax=Nitrososphaera sp. AFS TaxID=2301191 RepID=UPI0013924904|nr:helix-turn-helix domain-containing protein [Nitrososphaera sp. AFS]NAL76816.1 TrmB family transcriptional regulator [Nitrososphaera sp. AFS]
MESIDTQGEHSAVDLVSSLEELGLSRYEAGAYLTMIRKGSLGASEISYYANLPRTKVYSTLKKLEKKRLSIVSQSKPLVCSAIPPEEAFREIVRLHERRSRNTKRIVDKLQRITEEQRPKTTEERRYHILDPISTVEKLKDLITNSRFSVCAILDGWGVQLFTQCRSAIIKAITNGVNIKLLVATQCVGSEHISSIPEDIELKVADVNLNLIVIDSSKMVAVDSSNGKAALFSTIDVFGMLQLKNFEAQWSTALNIRQIANVKPQTLLKANKLIQIIENARVFEQTASDRYISTSSILESIRECGLELLNMGFDETIGIVDCALRIGSHGYLTHDKSNNIVSLRSNATGDVISRWVAFIEFCFKNNGIVLKVVRDKSDTRETVVHLKLAKSIE